MVNSRKLLTVSKNVASFDGYKSYRGEKKSDGKILCRTVVQRSILECGGVKMLSSGKTLIEMSVTRKVSFKA